MAFKDKVSPIDKGVSRTVLLAIAIVIIAVGSALFSLTYVLLAYNASPAFFGLIFIWVGSLAFFYAVISEEHTMKELYIRHSYFFTGLLSMILGMFFISMSGLVSIGRNVEIMEFGVLLVLLGGALIIMSAQRTYDYSKQSGLFALFAGVLLIVGGILANNLNVSYAGVFVAIFSGVWMGLRSKIAA